MYLRQGSTHAAAPFMAFCGLLISILTSSASWGQCFQPTTVALNYVSFPAGNFPFSVAKGDFNDDGRLDVVTANSRASDVSVLLNNGDESFGPPTQFKVGDAPFAVVVGDFNTDGKPDLATANLSSNTVTILSGNGNGSFALSTTVAVGERPVALTVGDINQDGKPDLAVANSISSMVSILLNQGNGSFTVTHIDVGNRPVSVVIGDFNDDDKPDLAAAINESGAVSVLLGDGTGGFGSGTFVASITNIGFLATGDFNGDSKLDLAVTAPDEVQILLGTGFGSFNYGASSSGSGFREIVVEDMNGDSKLDLVFTRSDTQEVMVWFAQNDGTFTQTALYPFRTGAGPASVVAGDFTGDGKLDLVTASALSNTVSLLKAQPNGSFGSDARSPRAVTTGDFNGDGKLDLVTANYTSRNVTVLLRKSTGGFSPPVSFRVRLNPVAIQTADFTGDGKLDLATANSGSNDVSILTGNGNGTFDQIVNIPTGGSPSDLVAGDFNGDNKPDLAVANSNSDTVSVLLNNGSGGFNPVTNFAVGSRPIAIVMGDFNGDSYLDLVTANGKSYSLSVLLGNGDGGFSTKATIALNDGPKSLAVGDVDGDGYLDLAAGTVNVNIFWGDGTGNFTPGNIYAPTNQYIDALLTSDFNNDNQLDMAVVNTVDHTISVSLGGINGTYNQWTNFNVGAFPTSIALGDFNSDGTPDLVTANRGLDDVTILLNCTIPATNNTAPTVVNPVPAQVATLGQGFTLNLASTFTDAQTPNDLKLSAAGLPAGLSLSGKSISGTPSVAGVSTVTVTATDPGALSVNVTFTITVTSVPTPAGAFEGFLDKVECESIRGWAWDANQPNSPVTLEFFADGTRLGTAPADIFRPDLQEARKGNGAHAYRFETPQSLKDGKVHVISARIKDTDYVLKWAPKTLACGNANPDPGNPGEPPVGNGYYDGYLDKVECGTMRGWAWDASLPNNPVTVEFLADGQPIGTAPANIYRPDLKNANKGNGAHAYSFPTPASLKDGQPHQISARIANSSYTLRWAPKTLTCSPGSRLAFDSPERSTLWTVAVAGNPVEEDQVNVEIRHAQGQTLRLDLLDQKGRVMTGRWLDVQTARQQASLSLFGQASGLYLLRVYTAQRQQVVKVLKK